jgi:hypothetical protein
MHPYMRELLARERARELRMQAQQARPHVRRAGRRNFVRHRVGWTLVEIGLRLASTSQDGRRGVLRPG